MKCPLSTFIGTGEPRGGLSYGHLPQCPKLEIYMAEIGPGICKFTRLPTNLCSIFWLVSREYDPQLGIYVFFLEK